MGSSESCGLSWRQALQKRAFDIVVSVIVLVLTAPVVALVVVMATVDTRQWGLFSQVRVGKQARLFHILKVRTMRSIRSIDTNVTVQGDRRVTPLGRLLRATKLDELPQFVNVLFGAMSVVGPRPDVQGYADALQGAERVMLAVRPGITGPASIFFRDEEALLAAQDDPEAFNEDVLWPAKVAINVDYVRHYSFAEDLRLVIDTAVPQLKLSRASKARTFAVCDPVFPQHIYQAANMSTGTKPC